MSSEKICIIYHYYEANTVYRENFLHFLAFGPNASTDIICVISGEHTVNLPAISNVKYIFTENKNYDYGGHSYALKTYININIYKIFIFINSSVRGPYVPPNSIYDWTKPFIEKLSGDTGLVGTTINILSSTSLESVAFKKKYGGEGPFSHVQTMAFAMTKKVLEFLLEEKFFDTEIDLKKNDVICDYEILLSQLIIRNGWNIKCLLPEYNEIDYRSPHKNMNPTARNGDPCYDGGYFGRSPHPYEVIFVKTNRSIWPDYYLNMLSYSMLKAYRVASPYFSDLSVASFIQKKLTDDVNYAEAYREGIFHCRRRYGEEALWQMVAWARGGEWTKALHAFWIILIYYPQGLLNLFKGKMSRLLFRRPVS